jgi:threonine synthase
MGAPIDGFIVASNTNDILARFINDGDMTTRDVVPTLSPSMDIQVSSNFERLLFEMNGRDGGLTAEQLTRFRATGRPPRRARPAGRLHRRRVPCRPLRRRGDDRRDPPSARRHRHAVDPHTATGTAAARALGPVTGTPVVTLATAHPGQVPRRGRARHRDPPRLPPHLADLFDRSRAHQHAPERPGRGPSVRSFGVAPRLSCAGLSARANSR